MTILKRLVVTTGTYQKDGETKKRTKVIGHLHSGQYGEYITLNADVNLAAFPRKDGDDRVMVNMYDEESKPERARQGVREAKGAIRDSLPDDGFGDDIPFS